MGTTPAQTEAVERILADVRIGQPVAKKMTPIRRRAADVTPESLEWLWDRRVARGKLTVMDGDPGLGKTTALLNIAALVSTGRPMPFSMEPQEPRSVILICSEDGSGDTIVPRLQAAGADLNRVEIFTTMVDEDDVHHPVSIPDNVTDIEEAVRDLNAAMLVIDPLVAHFSDTVDNYKDMAVRRALNPVVRMAQDTGVSVIAVRHPAKGGGKAIHRGGGSVGIIGAARTGLYVCRDPEDDGSSILAVTKSNVGRSPEALRFTLTNNPVFSVADVEWVEKLPVTAEELLAIEDSNPDSREELFEARVFLKDLLLMGPVAFDEIKTQGRSRGITETALKRAKRSLKLKEYSAKDKRWMWDLRTEMDDGTEIPW